MSGERLNLLLVLSIISGFPLPNKREIEELFELYQGLFTMD